VVWNSRSAVTSLLEHLLRRKGCGGYFAYLREKLRFATPVDSCDAVRQVQETQ
jgi:hypothetical protein